MDEKPKLRAIEVFPLEDKRFIGIRDMTGTSDRIVTAPIEALYVLQLLDGRHNLLDIQADLTRRRGELVMSDDIRKVLEVLDEAFLLEGERFEAHRKRLVGEFAKSAVRKAASAGSAYPHEPEKLRTFLDRLISEAGEDSAIAASAATAGEEKRTRKKRPVPFLRGLIAPHIDPTRGRKSYADAFAALGSSEPAELFVVLGTSHVETTELFVLTRKDFVTPLGRAVTDSDAVDALLDGSGRDLLADEFAHRGEHSVELELVFLQRLCEKAGRDCRIVPVLCGGFQRAIEEDRAPTELPGVADFLGGLRKLVTSSGRRVCVVAGADLSHVGPRFGGDRRVARGLLRELEEADLATLACVERGDADAFFDHVARDDNARNICGVAAIYVTLKVLEPDEVRLLRYEQWCAEDGSSCVTFAACAIP